MLACAASARVDLVTVELLYLLLVLTPALTLLEDTAFLVVLAVLATTRLADVEEVFEGVDAAL